MKILFALLFSIVALAAWDINRTRNGYCRATGVYFQLTRAELCNQAMEKAFLSANARCVGTYRANDKCSIIKPYNDIADFAANSSYLCRFGYGPEDTHPNLFDRILHGLSGNARAFIAVSYMRREIQSDGRMIPRASGDAYIVDNCGNVTSVD